LYHTRWIIPQQYLTYRLDLTQTDELTVTVTTGHKIYLPAVSRP